MCAKMKNISVNRSLTREGFCLVEHLLHQGNERARSFLPQLTNARVVSLCGCGCASFNLSVEGEISSDAAGMEVLCDLCWNSIDDALFGVYVFARDGLLAGVDLWSIDGESVPTLLPDITLLRPLP